MVNEGFEKQRTISKTATGLEFKERGTIFTFNFEDFLHAGASVVSQVSTYFE